MSLLDGPTPPSPPVALPVAVGFWAWGIASGKPGKGPFARAHAKAWEITPQIFASR